MEPVFAQSTQERFALVIGNKNYPTVPLKNTINDASAISKALESIGFNVRLLVDSTKETLTTEIAQFYEAVGRSEGGDKLAVFYYAGHAIQVDHRNYLVPTDANLTFTDDFLSELFDINRLFDRIPSIPELQNIVILDACRDNPFDQPDDQSGNAIAASDGLAPLRAPSGTLIAYATEPGNVAGDGRGKHGTYTKYLLRHIKKRISIEEVFKKVRQDVVKATRNRQTPWEHSSLLYNVFINPPKNRNMPDLMTF